MGELDVITVGTPRAEIDWSVAVPALRVLVAELSTELGDDPVTLNRIDGVRATVEPIVLHDAKGGFDNATAAAGPAAFEGTVSERVFRKRAAVLETYVDGVSADSLPAAWRRGALEFGRYGLVAAPIVINDAVIGSLVVGRRREQPYGEMTLARVVEYAGRVARALAGTPPEPVAESDPEPRRRLRRRAVRDVAVGVALPVVPTVVLHQLYRPQEYRPSAILLVAVLAATTLFGLRAGLVATGTAMICASWAFVDPHGSVRLTSLRAMAAVVAYLAGAVLTFVLARRVVLAQRAEAEARWVGDTLIERAPVGIALFDRGLRFRRVNKKIAEINDRPIAGHLGKRPGELSAIAAEVYEPLLAAVLQTGIAIEDQDVAIEIPDAGIDKHFRTSYYPIFDSDGRLFGAGAVVEDTTATVIGRRRNERLTSFAQTLAGAVTRDEVVLALHAFLADVFHARSSFAFVAEEGTGLRVHTVMQGYEEAVARRFGGELLPWDSDTPFVDCARTASMIESESLAMFEERYPMYTAAALLATGDEARIWVPVADPADATRSLAVIRLGWPRARRLSDDSRALLRTIAAVVGLALNRIALADAAANDTFRAALDAMTSSVVIGRAIRDDDGRIVDLVVENVNQTAIERTGRSARELVGNCITDLFPAWRAAGLLDMYARVIDTGEPLVLDRFPYCDRLPSGDLIEGYWNIQVVSFGDDGYLSSTHDVSALVAADLERAASERTQLREREAIALLQRVALPERLPHIAGARFGALYRPAAVDRPLGGDWYDVFALDDHTVALVIADVAGHGADSAAAMVQVRNIVRAMAVEFRRPDEVIARTNRVVRKMRLHDGFVTCAYATLDTATRAFGWVLAGHPPPLRVGADTCSFLTIATGPPLGVLDMPSFALGAVSLRARDRVLFYTDGLIERRRESLTVGMAQLQRVARTTDALSPQHAVEAIGAAFTGHDDDVAVLCADLAASEIA